MGKPSKQTFFIFDKFSLTLDINNITNIIRLLKDKPKEEKEKIEENANV